MVFPFFLVANLIGVFPHERHARIPLTQLDRLLQRAEHQSAAASCPTKPASLYFNLFEGFHWLIVADGDVHLQSRTSY